MKYRTFPDLTGQRFNKIIVLDGKLPNRKVLIKCDCGTEKIVSKYDVFNGKIKSCGAKECSSKTKDLVGRRFKLLTVIALAKDIKNITGRCTQWQCQCDCGAILIVPSNQLLSGRTKSCGCAKSELISISQSIPIKDRVENELFSNYKTNAIKRKYNFILTKEEFVSFLYNNCYYCDSAPMNGMKKQKITGEEIHYFNGIDRVNNELGYALDNCVTCCKLCNHAKNNLTKEDFIALAKRIFEKHFVC